MANNNNNNNGIVLKVDNETRNKMLSFYKEYDRGKAIPYVTMQAVNEDVVITIYDTNKKGENKVMFQGTSADVEASVWAMEEAAVETSKKEKAIDYSKYYNCSSIGSDEVGTGDYFAARLSVHILGVQQHIYDAAIHLYGAVGTVCQLVDGAEVLHALKAVVDGKEFMVFSQSGEDIL